MEKSDYKSQFLASANKVLDKREEMENKRKLEEEKKRIEEEEKKRKEKWSKEKVENTFKKNKNTLINKTLDYFMSKVTNNELPPYQISHTVDLGRSYSDSSDYLYDFDEKECLKIKEKIHKELIKCLPEIPNSILTVDVERTLKCHCHEVGNNYAGATIHDHTDYFLNVKVNFKF